MKNFSTEKFGDVVVTKINLKRATFKEAEEFKRILSEDFKNNVKKIVIDLTDCAFMDSTFLSTMVTALKKASEAGGNLKLVNVHSETQSLIELTGTYKIFEVFQTKEEAVKSFNEAEE